MAPASHARTPTPMPTPRRPNPPHGIEPPLDPELILQAYLQGCFPMADHRHGPVRWYSPDPRAILPLDGLRVSRSLRRRLARGDYHISFDAAFENTIRACAQPRPYARDTWINDQIIHAYIHLHHRGFAHSVEAWHRGGGPHRPDTLAGGLYGLSIGGAFFGESMFTRATDASKVCLVHLVEHLRQLGFQLLDTQTANAHMARLGIVEISRCDYLQRLRCAVQCGAGWAPPQPVK